MKFFGEKICFFYFDVLKGEFFAFIELENIVIVEFVYGEEHIEQQRSKVPDNNGKKVIIGEFPDIFFIALWWLIGGIP